MMSTLSLACDVKIFRCKYSDVLLIRKSCGNTLLDIGVGSYNNTSMSWLRNVGDASASPHPNQVILVDDVRATSQVSLD